ncbi:hypothetical protein GCM10025857_40100 [Alicyclobacillus contaminans]|nr:hypothetical protein GCM10025857_39510 [Alicyclobacillus contaminans]GMA52653.1 hypothetical protein GCM10025857_40100 [Alicyclobacillus contaminans]
MDDVRAATQAAKIPDNVTPSEWLAGVILAMAHGYSADEAQEIVADAAWELEAIGG